MGSDKKQELSGIKLKTAILFGEKANKTTPSSSWKLGLPHSSFLLPNFTMNSSLSARKIGANLWEVQPQFNPNKNDAERHHDHGDGDGGGGSGLIDRRRRSRSRRHHSYEKKGFEVSDQFVAEPTNGDPQPPEIETILRKNTKKLPSLRNLSVGKNGHDLHHASSASCCSSMQVTPYACVTTPTGYTFKTSTDLLKVLNRIWILEERNSSHLASIKALKRQVDIFEAQIKTLLEERKHDHQEITDLKKSTHEQKKNAAQSKSKPTRNEISDLRSSFMREKKARILLESLCDEFAKGIRDYEQKVRFLQQKKDRIVSKNEPDRLILHVSEAWLDERAQMKCDLSEKTSISDNLCCEIETFLEAKKKQSGSSGGKDYENHEKRDEEESHVVSRIIDRGPEVGESSSKRATREGVKSNTLMAKLLEARLESQFSKSRTTRR